MSVIFQALQKLEPDREDTTGPADSFSQRLPMGTAQRRLLPRFIKLTALTALVAGLGIGAVHGVRWLGAKTPRTSEAKSDPVRYAMPQNTEELSRQAAEAGQPAPLPKPVRAHYYPPEAAEAVPAGEAAGSGNPRPPAVQADAPAPSETALTPKAGNRQAPVGFQTEPAPGPPPDDTALAPDHPSEKSLAPVHGDQIDPGWLAAEAARAAAIEKNARIGHLVRRIEVALQASGRKQEHRADTGETEALLGELARLKGEDSVYVNKLRAYRLMKSGQYEKAEPLLYKILAADAVDLEAGLNLAVVLINTGRPDQAGRRLKQLREVYPDNVTVAELLHRLNR